MSKKTKGPLKLFQSTTNKEKRRKKVPHYNPGDYIIVRYPEGRMSWGFSHRMLYILKRYKAPNKRKKLVNRYTYLVVDFYAKPRARDTYKASFADHTQNTFRTHLRGAGWRPLTEVEMDLEFIVKFGGPNVIAKQVIDEKRRSYQDRVQKIKGDLQRAESALDALEKQVTAFEELKEKEENGPINTQRVISIDDFIDKES